MAYEWATMIPEHGRKIKDDKSKEYLNLQDINEKRMH
tara:strand:- start:87 stop:197 length:111 start_codon:yes stop_codon:yes gene_type:complete